MDSASHNPSSDTICSHFGECGGCESQDLSYVEQLSRKQEHLRELFKSYWTDEISVLPSPAIWNYRNKVDFSFVPKHYDEPPPKGFVRETVLGFNRKGKWYWPLEIDNCRIAPEGTERLLSAVRQWFVAQGLRAYDSRTKDGMLRALMVREGKRSGQHMVVIYTSRGNFPDASFVDAVQSAFPATSIYRGIFDGEARGAFADELVLLDGEAWIEEELRVPDAPVRKYRISPHSFFQTNSLATEVLYGEIRRWVKETAPSVLYDLYGGTGGIALSCSDLVPVIRSVESVESATEDGEHNAKANGVDNVHFETAKMKNYLLAVVNSGGMESSSAAVVDPPRAGMNPKALRRLIEAHPPRILYVSCKPTVLAEDFAVLLETYELTGLSAVDLFPHTAHVEVLAELRGTRSY